MVDETEILIVGKRVDKVHRGIYDENLERVAIEVMEVIKGDGVLEVGDEIEVKSWYGICPYGVQMDRFEDSLVFLNKVSEGTWFTSAEYEAATYKHALCNDESIPLRDGKLSVWEPRLDKTIKYPMSEFRRVFLNKLPARVPAQ